MRGEAEVRGGGNDMGAEGAGAGWEGSLSAGMCRGGNEGKRDSGGAERGKTGRRDVMKNIARGEEGEGDGRKG